MSSVNRRDFLKVLTNGALWLSGLLGFAGMLRYLGYVDEDRLAKVYNIGLLEDYPAGSRIVRPEIPALIKHTEGGLSALSLVCTHLGCTVREENDDLTCPCHGSIYRETGDVMRGPANRPLKSLRVELADDGHILVHTEG
jgi:Rieske Fe-S protein